MAAQQAGDEPVSAAKIAQGLQRLDGLLVGRRGEMKRAGIVAVLHDAVADLALQFGIAVERGNEAADFAVPFFRGAVGELIFDHEVFHRVLPQTFGGGASPRNTAALRPANSSNEVGGRPSSAAASGQTLASLPLRRSANSSNSASAR